MSSDQTPNPYSAPAAIDQPAPTPVGELSPEMRYVARGLLLVYWGTGIAILSQIIVLFFARANSAWTGVPLLGLVVGVGMEYLGKFWFLAGPGELKTKWLVVAPIVLQPTTMVMTALAIAREDDGRTLLRAAALLAFVGMAAFVTFLASLANWVGSKRLRNAAWSVVVAGTVACGIFVMLLIAPIAGKTREFTLLALFLVCLAVVLRYIGLLGKLRQAVLAGTSSTCPPTSVARSPADLRHDRL